VEPLRCLDCMPQKKSGAHAAGPAEELPDRPKAAIVRRLTSSRTAVREPATSGLQNRSPGWHRRLWPKC